MANSRWNLLLRMEEGVVLPVKKDWIRAIGVWHLNISKMTSCCRGTMDMFLHLNMNPKKNQEPKKNSWVFNYISHLSAKRKIILTATLKRECIYIYTQIISLKTKEQLVPLKHPPGWTSWTGWTRWSLKTHGETGIFFNGWFQGTPKHMEPPFW